MGIEIKKSRVWIRSHIDNKNTQRRFKINIKELTQDTSDNFLVGLRGVLFQNPLSALKNNFTTK
ncbi:hypothetical protein HpBT174_00990 [Helicobacter pylori]